MSSQRAYLPTHSIVSAGDMSANITSLSTNIRYLDQVSIQISSVNTSAVGQWSVEGSLDDSTFITMVFNPVITPTTSGVNDSIMIDLKLLSFPYIRVKYTKSSGAGIATVKISGKGC